MKKYKPLFKLILFFLVFSCSASLSAQTSRHTLKLTVTTSTGASVTGTPVKLINTYTEVTYDRVLDENGYLEFTSILGGTYKLTITKEGLAPYINNSLVLNSDTTLVIKLQENVITPYGLNANVSYDKQTGKGIADFTWNNDEDSYFDDFESYEDFSISFAPWTGLDLDKASPVPLDITYPNYTYPQYATIFNPAATTPSRLGYPDMMPYSGLKCIAFIRANGKPNNDWLISKKILIKDGDVVSFMAKALGINFTEEQFRVAISETGNTDVNSFKVISAGNSEVANTTWSKFEYDLSEYAGKEVYIAINYMSIYRQMLMVDDFFVGRKNTYKIAKSKRLKANSATFPQYHVYLDGAKTGETSEAAYKFENLDGGTHALGVKAVYQTTETEIQTININVETTDAFAAVLANITTNNGLSADGISVYLSNTDSDIIYNEIVTDGKISIPFAKKGNYELSIQATNYKPYSHVFVLTESATFNITLEEEIVKPYNLTVDTKQGNGTYNAVFAWNQELGWSDSFESYPDFTQSPEGWITYDLDKVISYTIGWGFGEGQQYQFPGTGAASGPIVFNPSKTVPAMTGDAAAMAPKGDKYIAFFSAQSALSNDWLISPKQDIKKDYVLRFLLKSYPALGIVDKINIAVSETDNVSSFNVLDEITTNNETWVQYELSLDNYIGKSIYIGFNYVSYDGFLVQLDDVYVGPSTSNLVLGNVKSFEIYLDGEKKSEQISNTFTFEGLLADKKYVAGVKSVYESGVSEMAEFEFTTPPNSSLQDESQTSFKVYPTLIKSNTTFTVENDVLINSIQIFDLTGRCVQTVKSINSNIVHISVENLNEGLYTVKTTTEAGNHITKILVK